MSEVCLEPGALAGDTMWASAAGQRIAAAGLTLAQGDPCGCDWTIYVVAEPSWSLPAAAAEVWTDAQAHPEGHAVRVRFVDGHAEGELAAASPRAALFALDTALQLLTHAPNAEPVVATAMLVDLPGLAPRGILEGFYGEPYSGEERTATIRLMAQLKQGLYIYGPKDDPYARTDWAQPYPPELAEQLGAAAEVARANYIDFAWSVSPGLSFTMSSPGKSIAYSSDQDLATLMAKVDSVGALGIDRFALFLDDVSGELFWPEDEAAFGSLAEAHAFLMNRMLEALRERDAAAHLLVVGAAYSDFWPTWDEYNTQLGARIDPEIEVMWTGPSIFPAQMEAADMEAIVDRLGRKVSIWDNFPTEIAPLTGRAADLPLVVAGFYANPVLNERGAHPIEAFWAVQGTIADYTWNPGAYDPDTSFVRWQKRIQP